jgi:hypothetical protein
LLRRQRRGLAERHREAEWFLAPVNAKTSSKLICVGTDGNKRAMRVMPLVSICGGSVNCGSMRSWAKISAILAVPPRFQDVGRRFAVARAPASP